MFAKSGVRRNALHRRSSGWSRLILLAIATVIGIALLAGVVLAVSVTIDTFDAGTQSLQVDYYITYTYGTCDDASILGGERDAELEWVEGDIDVIELQIDYEGSNRAAYSAGDEMKGIATITWDGNDNDATQLDADGLCNPNCVDLTDGGTNDGLHVQIVFDDSPCNLTFKVYTGPNWSQYTVSLPGGIESASRVDVFFPFSGFTVGGGTGAVFTSTGAVVMEIDGTVAAGVDVSIDMMATDSNREYGDLPVGTYGTSILNANHIAKGLRLGNNCDIEATYNSSTSADGDDTNGFDDEDGVATTSLPWDPGPAGGAVNVTREGCADLGNCYVNGWIDWNGNGYFTDTVDGASEHVVNNQLETTDTTETYTFDTPTSLSAGSYYARFRICQGSSDCDNPDTTDTNVSNGEVEDYMWDITTPTAVTLTHLNAASVPSRSRVSAAAPALAFLVCSVAIGGVLMRRRAR